MRTAIGTERRIRALAALCLALVASCQSARAGTLLGARAVAKGYVSGPAAISASVRQAPGSAKLVFEMNIPVQAKAYVLADPDRVIIDLPETAFLLDPTIGRAPSRGKIKKNESMALISSFRFGNFAPGRSRIVIDLGGPAKIVRAISERTETGGAARLILELASTDAESFRAAARASLAAMRASDMAKDSEKAQIGPSPIKPIAAQNAAQSNLAAVNLPVVVLDPGHGGVDAGASNKDSLEKTIVFEFARLLAEKIEKNGRIKVVMTRKDDTFVPLGDRVKIAQDAGAALFVSIHADTLNEASVHGATVYTLSDRASDAESARIAAKENNADQAGGLSEPEEVVDVHDILFDLTRRETRAMSHAFARSLVSYWKNTGELNKNPMRSAGFRVLKAPDVPAVLLELGYLSSEQDLSRLVSPDWRESAATNVARSIERYITEKMAYSADQTSSVNKMAGPGLSADATLAADAQARNR